ncbi:prepilin-type N-terminal cleavage/methylation domain-containing protein [Neorhizobium sp. DT-125]|uniref:prepilin-type N-terminal cleavage/methylation domain-containing protein n=1 Tax=Neorhizobium sp. DT-125 TaxID=3396163 RepID=UPI003F1B1507
MWFNRETLAGSNAGFSLMEMLVVLAVLGLLFSIAVPSFRSLTKPTPASIARQVLHEAQLTRLAALKAGRPRSLIMDAEAKFIRSDAKDEGIQIPPAISFSATFGRDEKTTLKQGSITFYPDGSATGGILRFAASGSPAVVLSINWLTGIPALSKVAANDIR